MAPAVSGLSNEHRTRLLRGDSISTSEFGPYGTLEEEEIRLVHILPANFEHEDILCRLIPVSRDHAPPYRALSYCWGPPEQRNKGSILLEVGDAERKRVELSVTPTLEAALRRLRCNDGHAICINQNDDKEIGKQVQYMRIIYQKAEEVSIWLGVHDEKSLLAWDLIQDIEECHGNMEAVTKLIEPSRENQFAALLALFRRDHFWRIWVVQEITCAKKAQIYCGSKEMPWTSFQNIGSVMEKVRGKLRDTIYHNKPAALFSLMHGGPMNLKVRRQNPEEAFDQDKAPPLLDLLKLHGRNDDNLYLLPSWVPDWERRNLYPTHRAVGLHIREPPFKASGNTQANVRFLEDGEVLVATGLVVDTITITAQPFYLHGPESEVTPTLLAFHNWFTVYVNNLGSDNLDVFARTFCGGAWYPRYSEFEKELSHRLTFFFGLIKKFLPGLLKGGSPVQHLLKDNELPREVLEAREHAMVSAAALRMHAKRFVLTKTKLAGLAPQEAKEGDKIVVLLGCDFPVVLRGIREGYWRLIGEVYVDGIMYKERVDAERSFAIR